MADRTDRRGDQEQAAIQATNTGRRRFLRRGAAAAGAALVLPPWSWRTPTPVPSAARPVRVRGVVAAEGRGIGGVGVTDGLDVVETASDGTFELITHTRRPYVYLSLPAGYRIPQSPTGTARLHVPLAPSGDEMDVTFELEPARRSDENHAFLVLADPQTKDAYDMRLFKQETVPDVQQTISAMDGAVRFGLSCGDIMYDELSLYPEYEQAVAQMGLPFFQVIGNHDLDYEGYTDRASSATFRKHFGPTYYSFDRGAAHYVVLDDVFWNHDGYVGYLDAAQLAWLEADLQRVEPGRLVVVFQHIPALSTSYRRRGAARPQPAISVTNREALYALLEPFQAHIISGHTHEVEHVFEGDVHEHVCGAACGAWWTGPICYDGAPSGYGVFDVRGEELRWRYKATGAPDTYQVRAYARGADPDAPDEIVANVWDWDPEWTVVWYEDGERKGEMARRVGTDPYSEKLHRGDDLPPRRSWVEPIPTDHLFYAPAGEAAEIRVEATDRWGRTYSAVVGEDTV